jgi:hypothetical protein
MGSKARDHGDPALLAFVGQLLDEDSLDMDARHVAQKLLDKGAAGLAADELAWLDAEVIDPWLSNCLVCNAEPVWAEVLQVFDTGLCSGCFEKHAEIDIPDVRPSWMPLQPPAQDDDDLPAEDAAEPAVVSALEPAPV